VNGAQDLTFISEEQSMALMTNLKNAFQWLEFLESSEGGKLPGILRYNYRSARLSVLCVVK
jgi:hypothetical protein